MLYLDVKPWEANHPLNGKPCPVTGRIPYIEDKWKVLRPDYRLRTGILEPGIVLSLPVGYTAMKDTDAFFRNLGLICRSPYLDASNFVLIEDYSFHSGSDYEGRMRYIRRMIDEINPAGVVFFALAANWRLSIRMAQIIGGHPFPILLAKSYREALQIASGILGRPVAGMEKKLTGNSLSNEHCSFTVKTHSMNAVVATYSGAPENEEISSIIEIFQRLPENPKLTEHFTVVHDFTGLKNVSIGILVKLLQVVLWNQCNDKTSPVWVVCKSMVVRLLISLRNALPGSGIKLRLFSLLSDAEAAMQELENPETGETVSDVSLQQDALDLLDKMNWEQRGSYEFEAVHNQSLKNMALVLGALKQDVDLYLIEREKEVEQLELAHQRAIRLSMEIEDALHRSEQDRKKSEVLSKENLSLSHEISQSQKEVFCVLADYVDHRAGLQDHHTRRLADFVRRLAPLFNYNNDEQERLHDATLLYHVGFLGVPEGEAEKTAHCLLGGQVLGNMFVFIMQFASQIAKSHHEAWDGTGYPEELKGESIPREARLVALAEYILIQSDNDIDTELLHEAGAMFDPAMVITIRMNLKKILEWKAELLGSDLVNKAV